MPPKEDENPEIAAAKRHVQYKERSLSMYGKSVETKIAIAMKTPSAPVMKQLDTLLNNVNQSWQNLADAYCAVLDLDIDAESRVLYDKNYTTNATVYENLTDKLISCLAEYSPQVPTTQEQTKGKGKAATADPPQTKPILALKPFDLLHSSKPEEVSMWIQKFRAYYDQSRMDLSTNEVQLQYLLGCVDKTLMRAIQTSCGSGMAMWESRGVIDKIQEIFQTEFPLFNRRLEFLSIKRNGRPWLEWISELKSLRNEAQLDTLTPDHINSLVLYLGEDDPALKALYDQSHVQTFATLCDIGKRYASGKKKQEASNAHATPQMTAAAVTADKTQTRQQQTRGSAAEFNKRFVEAFPHLKGKCIACGSSQHIKGPQCKIVTSNYQCKSCGARKHHEAVCMRGKWPGQQQRTTNQARGSYAHQQTPEKFGNAGPTGAQSFPRNVGPRFQARQVEELSSAQSSASVEAPPSYTSDQLDPVNAAVQNYLTSYNAQTVRLNSALDGSTKARRVLLVIKAKGAQPCSVAFLPDTGADVSILPATLARQFHFLADTSIPCPDLRSASGQRLACNGVFKAYIKFGTHRIIANVLISEDVREPLLCGRDMVHLRMIPESFLKLGDVVTRITDDDKKVLNHVTIQPESSFDKDPNSCDVSLVSDLLDAFKDICHDTDDIPTLRGFPPMHLYLKNESLPVIPARFLTARKIPIHKEPEAHLATEEAVKNGVIVPYHGPVNFVHPSFFVDKKPAAPGMAAPQRLITDFSSNGKGINHHLQRPYHPSASIEELLSSIRPEQCKYMIRADLRSGYYQVQISPESQPLTATMLPTRWGSQIYCYAKGPQGLASTGDEFCYRTDLIFKDIEGCVKLVDDLFLYAPTKHLLRARFQTVLEKCREHSVTLSKKKLLIGTEVAFAGYLVSSNGIRPNPERIESIQNFRAPRNKTELQSFLGLANQLGKFLPDLSQLTAPLRGLLVKNAIWYWTNAHEQAFAELKRILADVKNLHHFDPALQTVIMSDMSRHPGALSYCLMQHQQGDPKNLKLIRCGSRTLTPAEANYATVELEALAATWGIEQCRLYLLGDPSFEARVDHKPLLGVFRKQMWDQPNLRLQRFRERLQSYNPKWTWYPGRALQIADCLSRLPYYLKDQATVCSASVQEENFSDIDDPYLLMLISEASKDSAYQQLVTAFRDGADVASLPKTHPAHQYSANWHLISLHKGLLCKDQAIIIPRSCRPDILQRLHASHSGFVRTTTNLPVYWPTIRHDIEMKIKTCAPCQKLRPAQPEEPLITSVATEPMEAVSADLFHYKGQTFLCVIDNFSLFPWVEKMDRQTSDAVIKKLSNIFLNVGFAKHFRSDGGSCFSSQEFKDFCIANHIHHTMSSAGRHESNSRAELGVKTCKYLVEKCEGYNAAFQQALFAYRNTPSAGKRLSPAELFFGRRQRGLLPFINFKTCLQSTSTHGKSLPPLAPGQRVLVRDINEVGHRRWRTGAVVLQMREHGRSYLVRTKDNHVLLRNRIFLKEDHTSEPANPTDQPTPSPTIRRSPRLQNRIN